MDGFTVFRRCEDCGKRCALVGDDGKICILRCPACGKEYLFRREPTRELLLSEVPVPW